MIKEKNVESYRSVMGAKEDFFQNICFSLIILWLHSEYYYTFL